MNIATSSICSKRLKNVKRQFDPYSDRRNFIRLDRNEDPVGYDEDFFKGWLNSLTVHDVAAYADSTSLTHKLARWIDVSPDNLYISAGSDAVIKNIFEVYVDLNDHILLQDPSWRMYDVYAGIYGAHIHYIHYNQDLKFNFEEIIQKVKSHNIRLVVLANPNQPTGTLIAQENLIKLLDITSETNTLVVIDEAYHLFTPHTLADAIKNYKNLIIVRTFSKAFGLAGLRIGYAIADAARIQELMLLRPVTDANSLALKFSEYLLDNMSFVMRKINDFVAGRDFLYHQFCKAGLMCYPSHTNFLLLRCPSIENAQKIILETKQKKYLLKGPFTIFPLENCIRISIGPLALMKKFWEDCQETIVHYSSKNSVNLTLEK